MDPASPTVLAVGRMAEGVATCLEDHCPEYRVCTAPDAESARDRLASTEVDAVVTAYDLPDASGPSFVSSVRDAIDDCPVVCLGDTAFAAEAFEAGATDFLPAAIASDEPVRLAHRIETALAAREARQDHLDAQHFIEQLFDQVPTHLYVKDEDGRHLWTSTFYENAVEDAIGKTDRELYPEVGEDTYRDDMHVIETGEPILDKVEHLRSTDDWNLTSKVPWYDRGGEIQGLIGVTRNINERKAYQQRLERQNDRLDDFAGIVSHDLKNVMQVLEARLAAADSECDSEHIDHATENLDRMERLLEDTLTLARQGETVGDVEPVELASLAADAWDGVGSDGATLVVETDATVLADAGRLRSLLENLFQNARRHGPDDVDVTVGTLKDRSGFFVADDGDGIPDSERDRVFEAGYSTAPHGTGFGLRIVAEIAEAHGWTVDLTTSIDGGARVELADVSVEA